MEKNNQLNNSHLINEIERLEVILVFLLIFTLSISLILVIDMFLFQFVNVFIYIAIFALVATNTSICMLKIKRIHKRFSE